MKAEIDAKGAKYHRVHGLVEAESMDIVNLFRHLSEHYIADFCYFLTDAVLTGRFMGDGDLTEEPISLDWDCGLNVEYCITDYPDLVIACRPLKDLIRELHDRVTDSLGYKDGRHQITDDIESEQVSGIISYLNDLISDINDLADVYQKYQNEWTGKTN